MGWSNIARAGVGLAAVFTGLAAIVVFAGNAGLLSPYPDEPSWEARAILSKIQDCINADPVQREAAIASLVRILAVDELLMPAAARERAAEILDSRAEYLAVALRDPDIEDSGSAEKYFRDRWYEMRDGCEAAAKEGTTS